VIDDSPSDTATVLRLPDQSRANFILPVYLFLSLNWYFYHDLSRGQPLVKKLQSKLGSAANYLCLKFAQYQWSEGSATDAPG
jgi:hypothetical protein